MNQRRRHQGGWMASFIVVGAVLVVGVLGGLYYLKIQHDNNLAKDSGTPQVSKSNTSGTSKDNSTSGKKATTDNSSKGTASTNNKPDTSSSASTGSSDSSSTTSGTNNSKNLPQTGPSETILSGVVLALVTFSTVGYMRSRRT